MTIIHDADGDAYILLSGNRIMAITNEEWIRNLIKIYEDKMREKNLDK
jgi:hypothetical protein